MFKLSGLTKSILGLGVPFLIVVLGYLAACGLYQTQGRHGDEHFAVGKEAPEEAEKEEVVEPDFAALLAAADLEKGAKVFAKCKACHKLESGANATGPYLVGIVGRDVAVADGFKYSDAMKELGGQWTPDLLNEFLTKPKDLVPGNKMTFSGLKKIDQRANLIAYLATISE